MKPLKESLPMKRILPWYFLLALVMSVPASAETSVRVGLTLGNAPPPPVVRFRAEPRMVIMPTGGVSYYGDPSDYDYFRYGSYFYIYNGGYWYRSAYYRGPFIAIRESYVPRAFYGLHDRGYKWHHAWKDAPPGAYRRVERREERQEGDRHERREQRGNHGKHEGHGHDKD
jgi:hypothetical protein